MFFTYGYHYVYNEDLALYGSTKVDIINRKRHPQGYYICIKSSSLFLREPAQTRLFAKFCAVQLIPFALYHLSVYGCEGKEFSFISSR